MNTLAERRHALLRWTLDHADPEKDGPLQGIKWALNHARLALGESVEAANAYFESYALDRTPQVWRDGKSDDRDWDFPGTNVLRTVLDFGGTKLLSEKAVANLCHIFTEWQVPRVTQNRDNNCVHRYPAIHTENHDIMCLTIGLFGEIFAGRDGAAHVRQLRQSLSCRFRRGWTEWHSHVYQVHYLNPLLILADHAPDAALRRAANELVNVQLAERAALSLRGYLGGPYQRGYDPQFTSDRNDHYLPVMWLAFGLPGEADGLGMAGMHFAASRFAPHPVVNALAEFPAKTPLAVHRGTRDCSRQKRILPRRAICYWNTPHVSMGSMRIAGRAHQARFFNVLFASEPSRNLRTHYHDPEQTSPWEPRREQGAVVQHENWLVARGKLVEEGGVQGKPAGAFRLYREGKGLCAVASLDDDLHVFQTGDLHQYDSEEAFVRALTVPERSAERVSGRTTSGQSVSVYLPEMALSADGKPGQDWSDKLHAGPWLESKWDSGKIEVIAGDQRATFGGLDVVTDELPPEGV